MSAIFPKEILPGATFGVIAPGSPPTFDDKIRRGVEYLENKGYRVILGESVYARDGYLSGSDAVRARDINNMFIRDDIDAIICTRGGYGCTRLLDKLEYDLIRTHPKSLIGFSDVTALHLALLTQSNLVSFAGPMLAVELQTDIPILTERSFWNWLENRAGTSNIMADKLNATGFECTGIAEGRLIGGNMAVLMSLIGTRFFPGLEGSILFLEDIGEPVYKIDRMFSQFRNCGFLDQINGVILGSFTGIPESEPDRDLSTVVCEYLEPLHIPVLDGFPFGHTAMKLTIPIGATITMNVAERCIEFHGVE